MNTSALDLDELLAVSPFHDYVYSYPHKTAYRPLAEPRPLADVWQNEDRSRLSLYLHVPFCEMRCGFCNLFTAVDRKGAGTAAYLRALAEQAEVVGDAMPGRRVAQVAIGGGTPTLLDADQLEVLLGIARRFAGQDLAGVPVSVECSPLTLTEAKVAALRAAGVDRVSIGVQSFDPDRVAHLRRPQDPTAVERSLAMLADAGFATLNLDLIYGDPMTTPAAVAADLDRAIDAGANELYLYPLYVRGLTPLGMREVVPDGRSEAYRAAVAYLSAKGWRQRSLRRFQAPDAPSEGADHRCQVDGMVGLGVGARSYTTSLHYSHDYAVAQPRIRSIIDAYCAEERDDRALVRHGFELDGEEQRRRFVILTLLDGAIDGSDYAMRFGEALDEAFPELQQLVDRGLARRDPRTGDGGSLRLTDDGVAAADTIGHWLFSESVRERMRTHELR